MSENAELVLTPTVARVARRSFFWLAMVLLAVLVAFIGIAVYSSTQPDNPMSATSASPEGARALVEVLRREGVEVVVADTMDQTEDAVTDPSATTLFVYDPNFFLDEEQMAHVLSLADTVVVLDPAFEALNYISPQIASAGYVDGTLEADCGVTAAKKAESITGSGRGYRVLDGLEAETCFGSGDEVYSLVRLESHGTAFTVLGTTSALTNETITSEGNAALALNLLGEQSTLVWYIPTAEDYDTEFLTPADLTPDWVIPVNLALLVVGLAAILWRGRRLGPLIVENLPVTVRASETMQGRARLYEKANARLHTLDSLRIGTIARLATICGLPALATVDEIVAATAVAAAMDPAAVRSLLVDAQPSNDRELVRLSDELLRLESTAAHNSRPQ